MEFTKRSKNFTEREKMLLIEVSKEYLYIIDNKKTDGCSVDAKKRAWSELARKYNAVSETGVRTEKQLHALYDNIKKKSRKNKTNDMETAGETLCQKTTVKEERDDALLIPHFVSLPNDFDSSASYCSSASTHEPQEPQEPNEDFAIPSFISKQDNNAEQLLSPQEETPARNICFTDKKHKIINNLSENNIKRKKYKPANEELVIKKKIEILELQRRQELLKLEKTKKIYDLDIELKKIVLENAKIDLEVKKRNFNL